jgi:predicted membrane protein
MLSPESRLPSWIMISIISLQYWRIGLIHDNLQNGLRFQLKILCFFGVTLQLFWLNYDLTLYVSRQCLYKNHNKQLDLL